MRILLVGAGGFIGRHLLDALSLAGHSLIATHRQATAPSLPGVEWRTLDLLRSISAVPYVSDGVKSRAAAAMRAMNRYPIAENALMRLPETAAGAGEAEEAASDGI